MNVRPLDFVSIDLILQKVVESMRDHNVGKLASNWEGPYRVTAMAGESAYYLENLEERPLSQPWNVQNLRKYYQ